MIDNKSSTKTGIPTNVLPLTPEEHFNPQSIQEDLTENPLTYGNFKGEDGRVYGEWKEEPPKDKTIIVPVGNDKIKPKTFDETKKVLTNFHKNMATYPKYISHEGSTVLCVLLSMDSNPSIRMGGLPVSDGDIFRQSIPENLLEADFDDIRVAFDEQKDFIVTFLEKDKVLHTLRLFNTVIHPQNIHVPTSVVDIEDGDKISIGGKVVMDKNAVKKLIGFKPELPANKKEEEKEESRRQPSAGRNAFELRTDIMQMALDWATKNGKPNMSPDEVVNVAKKFYTFVENKRY